MGEYLNNGSQSERDVSESSNLQPHLCDTLYMRLAQNKPFYNIYRSVTIEFMLLKNKFLSKEKLSHLNTWIHVLCPNSKSKLKSKQIHWMCQSILKKVTCTVLPQSKKEM